MKWYKLTGDKYGMLTVLGVCHSRKVKSGTRKYWKCKCDCGKEVSVITASLVSGKTKSCGCIKALGHKGKQSFNWKGGTHERDGYVRVWNKDHPNAQKSGYVNEHTLIMSNFLGRALDKNEVVHHKNGIRNDNRIENLELWSYSHPPGQRIDDKIKWCIEFLNKYKPQLLKKKQVEDLYPIKIEIVK